MTRQGRYYTVENAKLYTLPEQTPELSVAAVGEESARIAAEIGVVLISTAFDAKVVDAFGRDDRPRYGQLTVCWVATKDSAEETANSQ